MKSSYLDFSVIICTRNRRDSLNETLDSLVAQITSSQSWEVLVVDNGSDDGTSNCVEERIASFPVSLRVVVEPIAGLSHARNKGLAEAMGGVVIFIDDDVTCSPGWLAAHQQAFRDPELIATGGRIVTVLPHPLPRWVHENNLHEMRGPIGSFDYGEEELPLGAGNSVRSFFGGNMGMRKSSALSVDGFRSDLGWGNRLIPSEETDLLRRLGDVNALYLGKALVEHRLQPEKLNLRYFQRWYRGSGRASVLMRPPANPLMWAVKFLVYVFDLLRFSPAILMGNRFVRLRTFRKFHQTCGRFAQLMGF
ncbi:MAG TPA: hypothetical protein DDW23_05725 [Planctomycetes bacterium]|nr:hypothetical protein [Planctomycetota bacterium]